MSYIWLERFLSKYTFKNKSLLSVASKKLLQADKRIAMTKTLLEPNYRGWQMEKYGNIVPDTECTPEGELISGGLEELNRLAEWVSLQSQGDQMSTLEITYSLSA
jgi:hypothetical protein